MIGKTVNNRRPQATSQATAMSPAGMRTRPERDFNRGGWSVPVQAGVRTGGNGILLKFAVALIIILMARPFDVVLVGFRIPLMICTAAVLAVFFTGGLRGLTTRPGQLILALAVWDLCASMFGIWKGGSVRYMENFVMLLMVLFLVCAEGPGNLKEIQKLMRVVGVSVGLSVVVLARLGSASATNSSPAAGAAHPAGDPRLGGVGMFGNEGEFALLIGFVLPFWVYTALSLKNRVMKVAMLTGTAGLLWLLLMTGTRSGLMAFVPVCLFLLVRVKMTQRLALIVGGVIFCAIVIAASPERVMQRLVTWSSSQQVDRDTGLAEGGKTEAEASARDREQLLKDAITTLAQHPVFGVGAGNFAEYRATVLGPEEGELKRWFPVHNTYMQFGAEGGAPALILYVGIVLSVFIKLHNVRKRCGPLFPERELVMRMTMCLQMSMLFFSVMSAFQNCDRYPHLFVMAGLAVALDRVTKATAAAPRPEATSSPAPMARALPPLPARLAGPALAPRGVRAS